MCVEAPARYIKRRIDEEIHPYRTEFERDRDRILYSKAFRRLGGKTQIFLPLSHDHVRNRLTHTLEVNQIAQVTAKNLSLNQDLTEAISLGHDLGHTPFGHIGERTLNLVLNNCIKLHQYFSDMEDGKKGFKHNLHSLRVAAYLEKTYRKSPGMNLSNFTLWGIKNHSKLNWAKYDDENNNLQPCNYFNGGKCFFPLEPIDCENEKGPYFVEFYNQYEDYLKLPGNGNEAWSFEGLIVAFADEIAQRHHDIEDGLFMKIISIDELKNKIEELFSDLFDDKDQKNFEDFKTENAEGYFIPLVSRFVVNFLNKSLIDNSLKNIEEFKKSYGIKKRSDFIEVYLQLSYEDVKDIIDLPSDLKPAHEQFKDFLKNRILNSFEAQRMDGVGTFILKQLLKAYLTNPKQLQDITLVAIMNIYNPPSNNKGIQDYSEAEIGKIRESIDDLSKKADQKFQCDLLRGICDHIAGMTDKFSISEYQRLYGVDFNVNRP